MQEWILLYSAVQDLSLLLVTDDSSVVDSKREWSGGTVHGALAPSQPGIVLIMVIMYCYCCRYCCLSIYLWPSLCTELLRNPLGCVFFVVRSHSR